MLVMLLILCDEAYHLYLVQALARKGSPEEKEALAFSLLDIQDDGCVRK